jgi:hypothetical protein
MDSKSLQQKDRALDTWKNSWRREVLEMTWIKNIQKNLLICYLNGPNKKLKDKNLFS